ncbi:MAG: hypothetical protein M1817_003405 [Caeruleum heppii]|nr:MAG: hypothetical protein M1817_003405 [Caeruleum heppii]
MLVLSDLFRHRRDCRRKQEERASRISNLPSTYLDPIDRHDREILDTPIESLVQNRATFAPIDILRSYGKVAIKAQHATNCLTEVMIQEAEGWSKHLPEKGPLRGIPVSLKDTVMVGGFDSSVAYSSFTGKPKEQDGPMVRLLKDAGALPYVKTNCPITLLSFESANDVSTQSGARMITATYKAQVWGRTTNPHNSKFSPGGSTGGESALLAFGGGRIGIGSDVAGSVRLPAHFSGMYALRCSTGRWPKMGMSTSMSGQEGVPSVFSPMARTLGDLSYFTRSILTMQPWKYDHSVHPIGWRPEDWTRMTKGQRLRIGVMRDDGVVTPSPACARALDTVVSTLQAEGHDVFEVHPPSPSEGLVLASQLLNSDGCQTFLSPFRVGEWNDPGAAQLSFWARLPRPFKYFYYLWVRYVRHDDIWAGLLKDFHAKSAFEQWKLVARREAYRARWHDWWQEEAKIDVMLTVPNATPALPHNAMQDAKKQGGSLPLKLDYTAGVLPITHVDRSLDGLPPTFDFGALNGVAQGSYLHYDAEQMHGLPVGVQVVGQRLQEERVLAMMERIETALEKRGEKYELLNIE